MVNPMMPLPTRADDPRLEGWYHTIELAPGIISRGVFDHRGCVHRVGLPGTLKGKTALDVGTGDGFWAFEMERRDADRVVAIDVARLGDCDWLPQIRDHMPRSSFDEDGWPKRFATAHAMRRSRVRHQICNVYDLSPQTVGSFDVVFCGSLLLHLKNPLQALINIRSVCREMAVVETAAIELDAETQFPDRPYVHFGLLHADRYPGEHNVFWGFSTKALCDMLIYAGFSKVEPQERFALHPKLDVVSAVARV